MKPKPDLTIEASLIDRYRRPGVYVYMKGNKALYIGVGAVCGVACRCLSAQHHKREAIDEADRVDLYLCNTRYEAVMLEASLIRDLKPTANKSQPLDRERMAKVHNARKRGESFKDIAARLGISRQRAHQLAARARQFRYKELVQDLEKTA